MKRSNLIIALLALYAIQPLKANVNKTQSMPYQTAIGLRFGGTEGLTFKQHIGGGKAIEAILGFRPYGMSITGLYEVYKPTNQSGLVWYYGGGAHVGWGTYRNYYHSRDRKYLYYSRYSTFGIDGVLGIEYKIPNAPIALSLDIKPAIDFYREYGQHLYMDPGFGVKVCF